MGVARNVGGQGDARELAMVLKERQLEIEELWDRNEEYEQELGKLRQALDGRGPLPPGAPRPPGDSDGVIAQYERRLAAMKTDAVDKEQRFVDVQRKLEELGKSLGAEGILKQNLELEKQVQNMKREVGDAKKELSTYLSDAASIVYENDLLRSI